MAVTKTIQPSILGGRAVIYDSDSDSTAETDVAGGSCEVDFIVVDNSANGAQAQHFKMWDAKGPTVGTTAPDFIFKIPAGQVVPLAFDEEDSDGIVSGLTFSTALTYATVQEAGTAGTTAPTSDVKVWIFLARET